MAACGCGRYRGVCCHGENVSQTYKQVQEQTLQVVVGNFLGKMQTKVNLFTQHPGWAQVTILPKSPLESHQILGACFQSMGGVINRSVGDPQTAVLWKILTPAWMPTFLLWCTWMSSSANLHLLYSQSFPETTCSWVALGREVQESVQDNR